MLYINDVAQYSEKITHEENGDKTFCIRFEPMPSSDKHFAVLCVIDGVSSQNAARSSALAAEQIRRALAPLFVDIDALAAMNDAERMNYFFSVMRQSILAADRTLLDDPLLCGCTASIVIVYDEYAYVANVGDSPVYLVDYENGTLCECYTCHNEAALLVKSGELSKAEAKHHKTSRRLLHVVGGKNGALADNEIATQRVLLPTDGAVLLGSDGALGVFGDDVLLELVLSNRYDMTALCSAVRNKVHEENGKDDSSLIAAHISIGY